MREDDDRPVIRDAAGRFQKGSRPLSPGRRPLDDEVRAIFEAAAPAAARRLVELAFEAKDPKVMLAACELILSRLFGKPAQQVMANVTTMNLAGAHLEALKEITALRQNRVLELAPTKAEN